jgi:predicted ATPase
VRLLEVSIQNFKSLKSVTLKPGPLSVFIGPNGAGKSNLADALDFIGEIYRHGVQTAVAGRGGYRNICHRQDGPALTPITVSLAAIVSAKEVAERRPRRSVRKLPPEVIVKHSIELRPTGRGTHAQFRVSSEEVSYQAPESDEAEPGFILRLKRNDQQDVEVESSASFQSFGGGFGDIPVETIAGSVSEVLEPSESMLRVIENSMFPVVPVTQLLGGIYTTQTSIWRCRDDGVPGPNVQLGRHGENLPSVVAVLQTHHPYEFQAVLQTLQTIMPTLDGINVETTPQQSLRLAFQESGFNLPWTIGDISDGTVRTLGLLTALFDPSSYAAMIEEPENSLHPWAIGQFIEACRLASKTKQIMLTTHSPVVIDLLRPEEIWIVSKRDGATNVDKLDELDPDARIGWEGGEFTLAEYLDSGIVPKAVPAFDS